MHGPVDGEAHPISLRQDGWHLRDYQVMAAESFWAGGSGVVVLPCGAGKTMVGAAAMAKAFASDSLFRVGASAVQVLGGIGFTWEHDAHLYYKRLLTLQEAYGGAAEHLETLATLVL